MTVEVVTPKRFNQAPDVRLAEYRHASKRTSNSVYTVAESHREDLKFKRPGKGLPEDSHILGQSTVAEVVSPDAVELFIITVSKYEPMYVESPHEIFIGDEINLAPLGRLRWRPTEEGDYPPLEEGAVERPAPRVLKGIRTALDQGVTIHGFRSGGGLRVIRLEKDGELKGYGEHINVDEAMVVADEDFLEGHRDYKDVYGKIRPHYLTGSGDSSSQLDAWLLQGHTFDAYRTESGMIAVELKGWKHNEIPKNIEEQIRRHNKHFLWTDRGYTFESWSDTFPNGEIAIATNVLSAPEGMELGRGTFFPYMKMGESNNFDLAVQRAFDADDEEIIEIHPKTPQDQITA